MHSLACVVDSVTFRGRRASFSPAAGRCQAQGWSQTARGTPPGLARGVPGTQLAAPAASGVTEVARPVTGRTRGHHCAPKPRSAVPGGTRLGASRGAARTAQAGVRVPRSQGVPSADRPGVSRGGPVRRPPGAGGSRGSGGHGAVVERAQACGASAEWPERAEQRRGRGSCMGQRRRDGCVSKRRDGSGAYSASPAPCALDGTSSFSYSQARKGMRPAPSLAAAAGSSDPVSYPSSVSVPPGPKGRTGTVLNPSFGP